MTSHLPPAENLNDLQGIDIEIHSEPPPGWIDSSSPGIGHVKARRGEAVAHAAFTHALMDDEVCFNRWIAERIPQFIGIEEAKQGKYWVVEGTYTAPPERVGEPIRCVVESYFCKTEREAELFGAGQLRGMGYAVTDVKVRKDKTDPELLRRAKSAPIDH